MIFYHHTSHIEPMLVSTGFETSLSGNMLTLSQVNAEKTLQNFVSLSFFK